MKCETHLSMRKLIFLITIPDLEFEWFKPVFIEDTDNNIKKCPVESFCNYINYLHQ